MTFALLPAEIAFLASTYVVVGYVFALVRDKSPQIFPGDAPSPPVMFLWWPLLVAAVTVLSLFTMLGWVFDLILGDHD